MLANLTQNWGFMRIIRLLVGGYALVEAYLTSDVLIGMMGTVLVGMAILNAGCGSQGCRIPTSQKSSHTPEDVSYEEIHSK